MRHARLLLVLLLAVGLARVQKVVGDGVPLEVLRKPQTVQMIPVSELGAPRTRGLTIATIKGGTQSKPAGVDAWVARKGHGEGIYLVNSDPRTGLPIWHQLVDEAAQAVPRPAAPEAAASVSAGLFGF